jgi:hypothetical protein
MRIRRKTTETLPVNLGSVVMKNWLAWDLPNKTSPCQISYFVWLRFRTSILWFCGEFGFCLCKAAPGVTGTIFWWQILKDCSQTLRLLRFVFEVPSGMMPYMDGTNVWGQTREVLADPDAGKLLWRLKIQCANLASKFAWIFSWHIENLGFYCLRTCNETGGEKGAGDEWRGLRGRMVAKKGRGEGQGRGQEVKSYSIVDDHSDVFGSKPLP